LESVVCAEVPPIPHRCVHIIHTSAGYFELFGFSDKVRSELYKLSSISLCPNVVGQVATGLMVNPPKPGDESFPLYEKEKTDTLESLKRRALIVANSLNAIPGVSPSPPGARLSSAHRSLSTRP
jgi:aspartate/methionine/tyrosine aminotransferase